VHLINDPDWDSSSPTMEAQFSVRIDGWAARAGSRLLMPVGLFTAQQKSTFLHTTRVHPIYFQFPAEIDDDVNIEIPGDCKVASLPQASTLSDPAYGFSASYQHSNGAIHWQRSLRLDMTIVAAKSYGILQDFFQKVRAADEEQAVLTRNASPPPHATAAAQ
jgi:hypothetical protein